LFFAEKNASIEEEEEERDCPAGKLLHSLKRKPWVQPKGFETSLLPELTREGSLRTWQSGSLFQKGKRVARKKRKNPKYKRLSKRFLKGKSILLCRVRGGSNKGKKSSGSKNQKKKKGCTRDVLLFQVDWEGWKKSTMTVKSEGS